jgi:hypothetical protein
VLGELEDPPLVGPRLDRQVDPHAASPHLISAECKDD